MGSIITLGVGRLEIDWGKNQFFRNHSKLFLKGDIKPETYYYAENHREVLPAYSRPLRSVKRRLELLATLSQSAGGYTRKDSNSCRTFTLTRRSRLKSLAVPSPPWTWNESPCVRTHKVTTFLA